MKLLIRTPLFCTPLSLRVSRYVCRTSMFENVIHTFCYFEKKEVVSYITMSNNLEKEKYMKRQTLSKFVIRKDHRTKCNVHNFRDTMETFSRSSIWYTYNILSFLKIPPISKKKKEKIIIIKGKMLKNRGKWEKIAIFSF